MLARVPAEAGRWSTRRDMVCPAVIVTLWAALVSLHCVFELWLTVHINEVAEPFAQTVTTSFPAGGPLLRFLQRWGAMHSAALPGLFSFALSSLAPFIDPHCPGFPGSRAPKAISYPLL